LFLVDEEFMAAVRQRAGSSVNIQRVAIGGLRLSSFGLVLLVVGLALQTAGQLA
jgi:hypothetical protein